MSVCFVRRYALVLRGQCLICSEPCTVVVLNSTSVVTQRHTVGKLGTVFLDYGTSEGSASSILRVRFVPETQTGGVKRGLGCARERPVSVPQARLLKGLNL